LNCCCCCVGAKIAPSHHQCKNKNSVWTLAYLGKGYALAIMEW